MAKRSELSTALFAVAITFLSNSALAKAESSGGAGGAYTPMDFGAKGNAVIVLDGAITVNSAVLTTTKSTPFRCPSDVGKAIVITGAGQRFPNVTAAIGDKSELPLALVSTIASCQASNRVTLAHRAFFTVANRWTAFGTDDTAALRACVNAGTNLGGRCTITDGVTFMASNTATMIAVYNKSGKASISSGVIDGRGTIIVAPQGTNTPGSNDRLFFAINHLSDYYEIAAAIPTGASSFRAANASDAAKLAPGAWIVIDETWPPVGNNGWIDWAQVKSVSGATVTLTQPTRMTWPDIDGWAPPYVGLGWRVIQGTLWGVTLKDFTVIIPPINSGNGWGVMAIESQATNDLTIENVTCWNASYGCFASERDRGVKLLNNRFMMEAIATEAAATVDGVFTGNTFAKKASPLNQNLSPCSTGLAPDGFLLDGGTAFFVFKGNSIPEACAYGVGAYQGVHDGLIEGNTIGWLRNTGSRSVGINVAGGYRLTVANNSLAGADGSASIAVAFGDESRPAIASDANVAFNNHASETGFRGGVYGFFGARGTDCVVHHAPEPRGAGRQCGRGQ